MDTVAYVFIFVAFLLARGVTKGRLITDVPEDLGDFFIAMLSGDMTAVKEVLARSGTELGHIKVAATQSVDASGLNNGRLPDSALQRLSWCNHRLVPQAATAFELLNAAYRQHFGNNITVTDSYRTYASQVALRASKGRMAATPGTSKHGYGIAVDLGGGINNFGTPQRQWMAANAGRYGWHSPSWARQGGGMEEPWHWEYGG